MKINKILIAFFSILPALTSPFTCWENFKNMTAGKKYKYGSVICGTTAGVLGIWGYIQKKKAQKLNAELTALKDTQTIKNHAEQELSEVERYTQQTILVYQSELGYIDSLNTNTYSSYGFSQIVKTSLCNKGLSLNQFNERLNSDIQTLGQVIKNLQVKLGLWENDSTLNQYINYSKESLERLNTVYAKLDQFYKYLNSENSTIALQLLLEKEFENKYYAEINLASSEKLNSIEAIILSKYSNVIFQFPYVSYMEALQADINSLKAHLNMEHNNSDLYKDLSNRASKCLDALSQVAQYVSNTEKYLSEKQQKPVYEREQARMQFELHEKKERLNAELREKQARIDEERRKSEAKLLKERNLAQDLANQRAQLERDRQALVVREFEIGLELARIRDGENIRVAVERQKRELRRSLETLEQKERESQGRILYLSNKIALCKEKVRALQSKISRPPCNPDSVDGLRDYVSNLENMTKEIDAKLT